MATVNSGPQSSAHLRAPLALVKVTPTFDGAGGVMLGLEIPSDSGLADGAIVTVKIWAGPRDGPTPPPALGAPTVVRSAEVPFAEDAPGEGYDAGHAPRYYGVTTRVFDGFDELGGSTEVFEITADAVTRTLSH